MVNLTQSSPSCGLRRRDAVDPGDAGPTDRLIYRDSYRTAYPERYVREMDGTSADVTD
jgi:hypothetical protein